jgi:hypothetical protein
VKSLEFRRTPHRDFCLDNATQIPNQIRPLPSLVSARMHHDAIGLAPGGELIERPIRTNLRGVIDQDLVVGILPICLIERFGSPIDRAPAWRRLNVQFDRILLVPDDIHEDLAAIEIRVSAIELCIGAREIVTKNFVRCGQ